jgi:hypothetical protein
MPLDKETLKKDKARPAKPGTSRPGTEPAAKRQPPPPAATPNGATGKTAAFWIDDEDRELLRQAAMLLLGAGIRPSDSLTLRAALRLLPMNTTFLDKARELVERDGRKLRHQKPAAQEAK